MRLYDVHRSGNCKKVRIVIHELGLPVELVPINPMAGENRAPDYISKNPMGKVPTFEDGDFTLWESGAIIQYLCSKKPGQTLWPQDARAQADVLRWTLWGANHFQPWIGLLAVNKLFKPQPDPAAIAIATEELNRFVPVLEEQLSHGEYLSREYSLADIAVGCVAERGKDVGVTFGPKASAWLDRLLARPAWVKAAQPAKG